jgi:hypothetical protein
MEYRALSIAAVEVIQFISLEKSSLRAISYPIQFIPSFYYPFLAV